MGIGTTTYVWNLTNGSKMLIEYTYSSVMRVLKVVEMSVDGKFHRENWMSPEARAEMMSLLVEDFETTTGLTMITEAA
jgi:hypothetical protein